MPQPAPQPVPEPPPPAASAPLSQTTANSRRSIREWLDDFDRDCDAARTKDEAEAILKRDQVVNCREIFGAYPRVIEHIEQKRQEMIDRFWSHDAEPGNAASCARPEWISP